MISRHPRPGNCRYLGKNKTKNLKYKSTFCKTAVKNNTKWKLFLQIVPKWEQYQKEPEKKDWIETLFRSKPYHQWQLVRVSWRTRQGSEAGADLVVTITTPDRQNCDIPELVCLVNPLLSDCRVEICTHSNQAEKRNVDIRLRYINESNWAGLTDSYRAGMGPGPALEPGEGRPGWWWGWPG